MPIILSSPTDKVQVVTSTVAALDYVTQYVEADTSSVPTAVDDAQTVVGRINTATTTNVTNSPPTTTKRWAVQVLVTNVDGALSNTVTVQLVKAGGSPQTLITALLAPGYTLVMTDTGEFIVYDATGRPASSTVNIGALPPLVAGTADIGKVHVLELPVGQAVAAESTPVVLASDQSSIPVLDTTVGAAVAALKVDTDHLPAMDIELAGIKTNTDHLPAMDTGLAAIKTNTDKIPALGQANAAASTPVVLAADQPALPQKAATGTFTDRSGVIAAGGADQQITGTNANRKYLLIQNVSDTDMWVNFGGAATLTQPSILLLAGGGSLCLESSFVSTEAVHIMCSAVGKAFTAKEA